MTSLSTPLSRVAENSSRWPPAGVAARDAGDARQEAEVGHGRSSSITVILHGVEADESLTYQVPEASGAGDDDVDTVAQRPLLAACGTSPKIVVTRRP